MRLNVAILTVAAFIFAAGMALLMAIFVGGALESRSQRHVARALVAGGLPWVEVSADGLLVTLAGTAPTEAMRFRAATLAGSVVGSARVIDRMEVTPAKALTAPRFSLELLRNDDGISMIGLVPSAWETAPLLDSAARLAPEESLTNMIETADFAIPAQWQEVMDFGLVALQLLPRSKISLATESIHVTAISDSPAQKRHFDGELGRRLPPTVPVIIQISAPRPVIAPFTLRYVIDADGPRFDACAADSERARARIIAAARGAGVSGTPACTLGLGSPSPRWAEAAEVVIAAMRELGAGSVTISDVDVTLIADSSVTQDIFDRVVGEATAKLPDVFSLKATLTPRPAEQGAEGPARFSATLSPEGQVQLRGRLTDARMRDTVEAYARARFGADRVYVATRLDESLPGGWGTRVLAGLAALAEVNSGAVEVEPERLALRGLTGNQEARAEIARQLSDRLGQGAGFSVDVTYEERLDPARALPSPDQCLALATAVLDGRQITFAPNSTAVEGESSAIVRALAEALADCPGLTLEIGGHTDSQGREEMNRRLSQERAAAVLSALEAAGADTSAMTARGYGPSEPIADNATEEGRIANRRIALKLVPPEAAAASLPPSAADPQAEDDGEALPGAEGSAGAGDEGLPADPEDEGEAPMGDAGDLVLDEDGRVVDDPAEAVTGAGTGETADDAAAGDAGQAGAAASPPAAAPVIQLDPPVDPGAGPAPAAVPGANAEADGDAEPEVFDWQPHATPPTLRPLRRPQEQSQ